MTGTASLRRRKLPAEHVVWLGIGMGLFHDRSIAQVVSISTSSCHAGRLIEAATRIWAVLDC